MAVKVTAIVELSIIGVLVTIMTVSAMWMGYDKDGSLTKTVCMGLIGLFGGGIVGLRGSASKNGSVQTTP